MRSACLTILSICFLLTQFAGAAPATKPAEMEPLLDGSLRYLPPEGWKLLGKSEDNLRVSFATEDGHGRMDLTVVPQPRDVPDTAAQQMAMIIGKGIREDARQKGRELLLQPRVEKDPRFFLVLHVRMRPSADENIGTAEERFNDLRHFYRVMGLNLVHVVVSAVVTTEEEAAPIHDAARQLLDGMRLTRGVGPEVFPRSNLKMTPPVDWKTSKTDQANGLVATYTTADAPDRQIIVRNRILPKAARESDEQRDKLLEQMIDAERRTAPFSAKVNPANEQPAGGGAYLRQIRATLQPTGGGEPLKVITGYQVVGDVLVSVRSVSEEPDETTPKLADELAASMAPIR